MSRLFRTPRALRAVLAPALVAVGLTACDDDDSGTAPSTGPDIAELAISSSELSTLVSALQAAGLVEALQADGPFTVFAPRNAAFDALGASTVQALLASGNEQALADLLTYHVVLGRYSAVDLARGAVLPTLSGETLRVEGGAGVTVEGAAVVSADLEASNGIVHVVDAVLVQGLSNVQRAALTPEVSTLVAALEASGLAHPLAGPGPFTIFAPVNAAFDAIDTEALLADADLLERVLRYHVVRGEVRAADLRDGGTLSTLEGSRVSVALGGGASINGASVVAADIEVGNGVIHLIDGVLLEALDLVERASLTPEVSTLVSAVGAADLAGVLSGPGPFTVFAPVNDAFDGIPADQLGRLLDPANQTLLRKVLTYHVIPGDVRAADLVDGATVTTVEGNTLTIDLSAGARVNGADIVATDIETDNGVIHLIDGVLLEHLDVVDQAVLNGFDTLVGAVQAAGLEATLRTDNGGAGFTVFAPTEAAFAALPAVPSDPAVLGEILLYHVLGGEVRSTDLSDGLAATTLQGGSFTVRLPVEGPRIEGAQNTVSIVVTDVPASNGVIHVIDAVLLPPM